MLSIFIVGDISFFVTLVGTPFFIKILVTWQYGQFICQDGSTSHQIKRETPTMGGVMIIVGALLGYFVVNLATGRSLSASGLLSLCLTVGPDLIGFLDGFAKIRKKQSLGLTPWAKILSQVFVGISSVVMALRFRNSEDRTPATLRISILRDTNVDLALLGAGIGTALFVIWVNFLITAWSNAVNLTDGLDGLAVGVSMIVFDIYTTITIWQSNQVYHRVLGQAPGCCDIRDPRDLATVRTAIVGSYFGSLWWNTPPAKIFVGDTRLPALGGTFAGISILARTEILVVLIGGLCLIEVGSAAFQMDFYRIMRKRISRMAPLYYHFELEGWKEVTMVIRFRTIEAFLMLMTVGTFYIEWLAHQ